MLVVRLIKYTSYHGASLMVEGRILMNYLEQHLNPPYIYRFGIPSIGPRLKVIKCD